MHIQWRDRGLLRYLRLIFATMLAGMQLYPGRQGWSPALVCTGPS